jgi:uncharacterized protein (DUF1697 family)
MHLEEEDMDTWIALLRGINVGGKNILPMAELVQVLESLGLRDVKTYIQSGNVVFRSSGEVPASLSVDIASTIETRHGFRPHVLIVSADQWKDAMESNPFPEAEAEPKTLHLFFMASAPADPDLEGLAVARAPSERFHLTGRVLYLYAPQGIGRSKLAAKAEKLLRVPATARNWRTVQKLWEMAETA